jgi:LacI family transcriptional regulator, galactose operon repressor
MSQMEKAGLPTLKDVARVSGLSISTVQRALTGVGSVDPKTKELVLSVARDLGYRPHAGARLLVTRRSQVIGVIVGTLEPQRRINHPFLRELLDALRFAAGDANYDLLLLAGHPDESPEHYVHRALSRRVDGLILLGIDRSEIDRGGREVRELETAGVPTICVDVDLRSFGPWFGYVTSDNEGGGVVAVDHLLKTGRTRIACIAGRLDTPPGAERLAGYRQELEERGHAYREENVVVADFSEAGGYRAMRQLLSLREVPDAVFACGDLMAIGAMRAIADSGLSVPGDIAVVGFDDIEAAAIVRPALTTIRQDREELARGAVRLVGRLLESPDEPGSREFVGPVALEVRGSTQA